MKTLVLPTPSTTSLFPIPQLVHKPLLPIYDKPMVYEPFTVLLRAGESQKKHEK